MYERLVKSLVRVFGTTMWDLSRCNDMYRLNMILSKLSNSLNEMLKESEEAVREMEKLQ